MKRVMRSAMAPRATSPATPTAMPTTVKVYPRGRSSRSLTRARDVALSPSPLERGLDGQVAAPASPSIEAGDHALVSPCPDRRAPGSRVVATRARRSCE